MIRFENVVKSYKDLKALDHLSFEIEQGSRITLFGPSGAGKSTILRLIAGLIEPDSGTISGTDVPISMAFQDHKLFEQLSCRDNIAFGLDCSKYSKKEIQKRTEYWAEKFECQNVLDQKAGTLSGGQQQRAGLARAFMKDPQILLLDETFTAMDYALKEDLIERILALQKEKNFTLISITHSLEEGQKLADRIFLMKEGRLVQQGSWEQLLKDPQDLFEASCFGILSMNILPADCFGLEGFMGLRPSSFSLDKKPEWLSMDVTLERTDDLGFGWLCHYKWKEEKIRVLSVEKKTSNHIYYDPSQLYYFNRQGLREKEAQSFKQFRQN